ncbi:MAG: hypothetical protein JSS57_05465 [Proteobacteria bacterium]|nr:hypothetical protein [Pseudomonadota bacterium]
MTKFIRSLMLPNLSSVLVMLMARISIHEEGINIQNVAGKSIGWIDIQTDDEVLRNEHFTRTAIILHEIINEPKRAAQPDWSYLNDVPEVAPAEPAVMPTRVIKKIEPPVETKT